MGNVLRGFLVWTITIFVLSLASYAVIASYEPHTETVASINDGRAPHHAIQVKDEKGFREALLTDPVAFFTMVLAIFTMGLAGVTVALWQEAKRASAEQASLTNDALKHAERSAKAAEDAVTANAETGKVQLRSYIGIEYGRMIFLPKDGVINGRAEIKCMNAGRTPAHNVIAYCGINSGKSFDSKWESYKVVGASYVFPRSGHNVKSKILQIELPNSGAEDVMTFIHGRIEYEDVFKNRHVTHFRYSVYHVDPTTWDCSLALCDQGNWAD